jgi:outer membrane protein TolC
VLGLALALGLIVTRTQGAQPAQQPAQSETTVAAPTQTVMRLNLAECIGMALHQQPRISAQRASLAVAEDGFRAVDALRLLNCLDPEIGVRRRQACLGVTAAAAGVDRAERETAYAVTRTYLTVLYAREQERVARGVLDRLSALREAGKRALEAGDEKVTSYDVKRTEAYIRIGEAQRIQAGQGVERAMSALKEAMGLGCGVALEIAPSVLAEPAQRPVRGDIVALALARRGELVQASVFVDVTCLEVEAQGTCMIPKRMDTFAAAVDIHATQIPQGAYDPEYRPGALLPEMPVSLAGSRQERMRRACDLNLRATAVLESARNLITLEAEDAYLRWEQAVRQVAELREGADTADKLAEDLNKDFTAKLRVKIDEVTTARVLAAQTRVQYNEYLYKELVALADLERVTAGGFSAGIIELFNPPSPPAPQKGAE